MEVEAQQNGAAAPGPAQAEHRRDGSAPGTVEEVDLYEEFQEAALRFIDPERDQAGGR